MTFPEFEKFQSELLKEVALIATTKGKEYANSMERFAHFNRLAEELGLKNYQVGWVYTRKHLDAIAQFCRTRETHSTEPIRGRFVDAICYLTLMAGMVEEAHQRTHYQDGTVKDLRKTVLNTGQQVGLGKTMGLWQLQQLQEQCTCPNYPELLSKSCAFHGNPMVGQAVIEK